MDNLSVSEHFKKMSPKQRLERKANYESLIKKAKNRELHSMPWMLPYWESGLKILNEVINSFTN
jgi:hypothetical protein